MFVEFSQKDKKRFQDIAILALSLIQLNSNRQQKIS